MSTYSYKINNFNITLSQFDDVIYIKIVDDISYETYENNINFSKIQLPFDKNDIFNIIFDSFSLKEDCNVSFLIKENIMKLIFNVIFSKKYIYTFDILLNQTSVKSTEKNRNEMEFTKENTENNRNAMEFTKENTAMLQYQDNKSLEESRN